MHDHPRDQPYMAHVGLGLQERAHMLFPGNIGGGAGVEYSVPLHAHVLPCDLR